MNEELIQRYRLWLVAPYESNPYFPSHEKQKEAIESKIKELTINFTKIKKQQ